MRSIAAHPCKKRKDGAPSVGTVHTETITGGAPATHSGRPSGMGQWYPTLAQKARKDGAPGLHMRLIRALRSRDGQLCPSLLDSPASAGGPAFELGGVSNTVGAPFLRVLCEGAGTTNACSGAATPPDSGTKSLSTLHSHAPGRLHPKDRNDNCSSAIARALPPIPVSPDCDAYTGASPRASSSSAR